MKKKKTIVKAIKCEEAVARLNDFLGNYLKGKSREELLKHISECNACMKKFEFEQLLKSKVQQLAATGDNAMKEKIEKLIASL